ncbi:MAG: amidotransferase [Bacteroidota bacterium]
MNIGLLLCDEVSSRYEAIVPGGYPRLFREWLPGLEMTDFVLPKGEFPQSAADFDAYVVSGSRHSVYESIPWIQQTAALVRDIQSTKKAYLGVCFGHQLLGHALGGRVAKAPTGWMVGVHEFSVSQSQTWMQPARSTFQVLMMCQDQVLELPPGGTVIASAPNCPVGMLQVGERMIGIQGHPEFPIAYERALLEDRKLRIGVETVEKALSSLARSPDVEILRAWGLEFLEGAGIPSKKNS